MPRLSQFSPVSLVMRLGRPVRKGMIVALLAVALGAGLGVRGPVAHASSGAPQVPASACPAIPAHFDYAHASTAELERYLLPTRPDGDPQQVAEWLSMVKGVTKRVCGADVLPTPVLDHDGRRVHGAPAVANCETTAPSGTKCSYNWTGYVAGDGTQPGFDDVQGKWNVETVTSSKSPADSWMVSWVGLGGNYPPDNLWQAGSGWNLRDGYFLWYEAVDVTHPTGGTDGLVRIGQAHPKGGDHIFAEVRFANHNPSGGLTYILFDTPPGSPDTTEYSQTLTFPGFSTGDRSAEWIDERTSCGTDALGNVKLWKLADYNYSAWTAAQARSNRAGATFHPVGAFAHTRWWMEDNNGSNTRLAYAGALGSATGSGTDNFKQFWEGNGTSQCPAMV